MLKIAILLGFVAVCSANTLYAGSRRQHGSSHGLMNVTELIQSNGYPVQTHTVETSDGYLLALVRIPNGVRGPHHQDGQYQSQGQHNGQYQSQGQHNGQYQSQGQHQGQHQSQGSHIEPYESQSQYNGQRQSQQMQYERQYAPQSQYQSHNNQQGQSQEDQSQSSSESAQRQNQHAQNQQSSESDSSSSSSEENGTSDRPVVLLMPGLLSSADDFVVGGPTEGLAYILADKGYDVFLGNPRGSVYGRRHSVLNPDRDPAFWRFCWEEMGVKDLPAMIDKIIKITGQRKIYYIGHMQGSTMFYVMASQRPEYNHKIRAMISLGPVAFMGQSTNAMLKLVSQKLDSQGWLIKNLGASEFKPSTDLLTQGGASECSRLGNDEKLCQNDFFLLNGFNSNNLNTTTMMSVLERVPAGASARQIIHFAQLVKSGRFEKIHQSSSKQEDYDLSKVTAPVVIFYTPEDPLSTIADVETLKRKLPNVKQMISLDRLTNNMDLVYGNDVDDIVYEKVVKIMRNMGNNA